MSAPPFALSPIGGAVLQTLNDRRALVLNYEVRFDAFARLMEQLPPSSAIAALLLLKRYGTRDNTVKGIRYA